MTQPSVLTHPQILQATSAFFGQPVLKLTAPGGRFRTALRAYLPDRTVIVSQRHDADQAQVEVRTLQALQDATVHVPRILGTSGTLVFQSDVGPNRLNWAIHTVPAGQRPAMAARAIDALFDIQRAARRVGLQQGLPTGPTRPHMDDDLIAMVPLFIQQMKRPSVTFDPACLSPMFRAVPSRFVKWDCRSGNAALGEDGRIRWFDFEECRLAQGPEDFGWLIADEAWPVPADQMLTLIQDRLTAGDTANPDAYMTYLEEFTTLQAIRRLRLIFRQAKRGGWLDRISILKLDKVGANPHLGERLSLLGSTLSQRNPSTAALQPLFETAAEVFRNVRQPATTGEAGPHA